MDNTRGNVIYYVCLCLSLLLVGQMTWAGEELGGRFGYDDKPIRMTLRGDKIYAVSPCPKAAQKGDRSPSKYCLVQRSLSGNGKVLTPFNAFNAYPAWVIDSTSLHWTYSIPIPPQPYPIRMYETPLSNTAKPKLSIGPMIGKPYNRLAPLNDAVEDYFYKANRKHLYYDFTCEAGVLQIWIGMGNSIWEYRLDLNKKKQGWIKGKTYSCKVNDRPFTVIPADVPLVVTGNGESYKVGDPASSLFSKVDLLNIEKTSASAPATAETGTGESAGSEQTEKDGTSSSTSSSRPAEQAADKPRLALLHIQKSDKYALFVWNNGQLKALDVLDDKKQNVKPFLAADEVDKKVAKAVRSIMETVDKGEKNLAKIEAAERKKREERAKKPRKIPLQRRLEE